MINHKDLQKARAKAGFTQAQAAAMVYTTERQWRKFESGSVKGVSELNNYKARTELFMYKIGEQQ